MNLTWHIVKKDLRALKWPLGLWILLIIAKLGVGVALLNADGTEGIEWFNKMDALAKVLSAFEFVSFVLARAGHDVSTARDGAEAIAFLTAEHFDLLVVDQHMPHATGAEVLLALRQRDPRTKALLMSGDHDMQSDAEVAPHEPATCGHDGEADGRIARQRLPRFEQLGVDLAEQRLLP